MEILLNKSKKIHFIGIGGCGMSGLAELLHKKKFNIQGSDSEKNIYTKRLESLGIPLFNNHNEAHLNNVNLVVISTAIKENNIELITAKNKNIPIIHRSELLAEIIRNQLTISISGTHGKTTTTGLLGWLFHCANLEPTIINGGIMNQFNSNVVLGDNKFAIVEADESDGSFNRIHSSVVIVTNINTEHLEYHKTFDSLYESFNNYVNNIPFYGFGVLCVDNPSVKKLSQEITKRRIITYGFDKNADISAQNFRYEPEGVIFDVILKERIIKDVYLSLLGDHNIQNSLAVIAIAQEFKIPDSIIYQSFKTFKGTKRRFTQLLNIHGIRVIDDYAHHPEEIKAVISAAKKIVKGKIYAVVQPPQKTSRFTYLFNSYLDCFDGCEQVLISPSSTDNNLTSKDLVKIINEKGIFARHFEDPSTLSDLLFHFLQDGDIVLCMGFGKITYWAQELASELEKRIIIKNINSSAKLLSDTRLIKEGDVFLAYPTGHGKSLLDGRHYIAQALKNGASTVLYQPSQEKFEWESSLNSKCIPVENLSNKAGLIASEFYNKPSEILKIIGVTGTNGKTSITQWLSQILPNGAVIGTFGYGFPNNIKNTGFTTPDAPRLQTIFNEFKNNGAEYVAMEVSSHALDQGRVNGTKFECAIFTNLTRDHLDYHLDMEEYGNTKAKLFKEFNPKKIIINVDDSFGRKLLEHPNIWAYGINEKSFIGLEKINKIYYHEFILKNDYYECKIVINNEIHPVNINLLGEFNLSNILAVLATLISEGINIPEALDKISKLKPINGRMEILKTNNPDKPLMIVDYAHTPDALQIILKSVKLIAKERKGEIYLVFGCGGDRDQGKRPIMGKIALEHADKIIVTNDNPRYEDPQKIAQMILQDIELNDSIKIILDRVQAIKSAVQEAKPQDIILVTGKGHETTQEINGEKIYFSDKEQLLQGC